MSDTDMAWAAGFLDGEGAFILSPCNYGKSYIARVEACNTDLRPLNKLVGLFEGYIIVHDKGSATHSVSHKWSIFSEKAIRVCEAVLPFMAVKAEQAMILIEYQKLILPRTERRRGAVNDDNLTSRVLLKHKLTLLNHRGPSRWRSAERAR